MTTEKEIEIPFDIVLVVDEGMDYGVKSGIAHATITLEEWSADTDRGTQYGNDITVTDVHIDEEDFKWMGGLSSSLTKKVTDLIQNDLEDKVEKDWNYQDFEDNAP
jgi:hypothetical protein